MQARALFLSTVLYGGAVFAALLGQPGMAYAETLRPQGNWAVSKIDSRQAGALPYCALTRRFGKDAALTFARNQRSEGSLAIDLPRGAFESGKSLAVKLEAGGEQRSYDASPVSERSVILRMGQDDNFYSALDASGSLRVDIAGQNYTFAVPDMVAGSKDLASCLGDQVAAASGKAVIAQIDTPDMKAMPAPQVEKAPIKEPAPQKVAAKPSAREMAKVEPAAGSAAPASAAMTESSAASELQQVKEENIRLRNALERERRQFENQFQQTGQNTSAVAELNEKIRILELENSALRVKSGKSGDGKAIPAATPENVAGDVVAMREDMAALKAENDRLTAEIKRQAERAAMLEKAAVAMPEPDKSRESAMTAQMQSLQARVATLEEENKALKSSAANAKTTVIESSSNIATIKLLKETEAQLSAVKAERDRMAGELEEIRRADADGRVRLASDNWNLEHATERFNQAEREIRRLGASLEQERAKCSLEKKDLEYMLFDPKIATKEQISRLTTLEEELATAKRALAAAEGNADKVNALQAKIRELETRIRDLDQRNASYETQIKGLKVADGKVAELTEKLGAANQQIARYEGEVKTLQAAAGSGQQQVAVYESRIRTMESQLADANAKIAGYERNVTAMKGSEVQQQEKVAQLEKQVSEANAKIAEYARNVTAIKGSETQQQEKIAQLEKQVNEANAEIARARLVAAEAEKKVSSLGDQKAMMDALRQEITSLNAQIANMQSEKTAMAMQLAQVRPASGGDTSADVRAARSIARADTVVARVPDIEVNAIGVPTGQATAIRPVAAPVMENAPVPTITSATANIRLMGPGEIEGILRQAGVSTDSGVQKLDSSMGAGRVAYRWQTGGMFGTAEQKGMENPAQFDGFVRDYIEKTRARCKGQFASVPALEDVQGSRRISAYEIACVDSGSGQGASAALTFYTMDGKAFTTIAHEAVPESMDIAMDARDRIIATIQGAKSASRQ